MGPLLWEQKEIDLVSQKRLNAYKIMKIYVNYKKKCYRVLEVTSEGLPSETKFFVLMSPNQQDLKI